MFCLYFYLLKGRERAVLNTTSKTPKCWILNLLLKMKNDQRGVLHSWREDLHYAFKSQNTLETTHSRKLPFHTSIHFYLAQSWLKKKKSLCELNLKLDDFIMLSSLKDKSWSFFTCNNHRVTSGSNSNKLPSDFNPEPSRKSGYELANCTCEMINPHSNLPLIPFSSGFTNHLDLNGSLSLFITLYPHQFSLLSTASLSLFVVKNITTFGSDVCHKFLK